MNTEFHKTWKRLEKLSEANSHQDLKTQFSEQPSRVADLSFEFDEIIFDFSKNLWNQKILSELVNLANHSGLQSKIQALMKGEIVNFSENRAAIHHLYRSPSPEKEISAQRQKAFEVANKYANAEWKTAFGKPVKHLVNIGIGGSFLGPQLAIEALTDLQTTNKIKVHFLSSIDEVLWKKILTEIDIESTLFCLSSKSLGTSETLINWEKVKTTLNSTAGYKPSDTQQSLVVATANLEKAQKIGAPETHILPFSESVGGRFSIWSSIGFPVLMAVGVDKFQQFLAGAHQIDKHFESEDFATNLPVVMALLSVWNRNFLKLSSSVCAPYDYRLRNFPLWAQQLLMESNGKPSGLEAEDKTSAVIFGDHGQLSQHAFFQALHQGSDVIPVDFIGTHSSEPNQKDLLINMLAQSAALMNGVENTEHPSFNCSGNRPSSVFILKRLTAKNLGQMMAIYEHMTFVQAVIWDINCFDQPGVELGKSIAKSVLSALKSNTLADLDLDASTQQLIKRILND